MHFLIVNISSEIHTTSSEQEYMLTLLLTLNNRYHYDVNNAMHCYHNNSIFCLTSIVNNKLHM